LPTHQAKVDGTSQINPSRAHGKTLDLLTEMKISILTGEILTDSWEKGKFKQGFLRLRKKGV
jgi:hypothetical protein